MRRFSEFGLRDLSWTRLGSNADAILSQLEPLMSRAARPENPEVSRGGLTEGRGELAESRGRRSGRIWGGRGPPKRDLGHSGRNVDDISENTQKNICFPMILLFGTRFGRNEDAILSELEQF